MEQTSELKQCSRCHSTCSLAHFDKNRKGEWFKTCNNCRRFNRDAFNTYREQHIEQERERHKQYSANTVKNTRKK